MYRPSICINYNEFDIDKFVIGEQKIIKTKNNIMMKVASLGYLNYKDELCDLYIQLPKTQSCGPFPQYPFGSTKKSEKDITGYTIAYRNDDIKDFFEYIICAICTDKFKYISIKPVFNDKGMTYLKLKMFDNEIITKFYKDKKCSQSIPPLSLRGHFGELYPIVHIKSIYFGSHGQSEYNASLQISLEKAIFQKMEKVEPSFTFTETEFESKKLKQIYDYEKRTSESYEQMMERLRVKTPPICNRYVEEEEEEEEEEESGKELDKKLEASFKKLDASFKELKKLEALFKYENSSSESYEQMMERLRVKTLPECYKRLEESNKFPGEEEEK